MGRRNADWLFSDQLKRSKVFVAIGVVMLSVLYFYLQYSHFSSRNNKYRYKDLPNECICSFYKEILHFGSKYYLKVNDERFEILNLPENVKQDLQSLYAVRGIIIDGKFIKLMQIRKKTPRIYKLLYSGLTALVVCSLSFVYFRRSKKGLVPIEAGADA